MTMPEPLDPQAPHETPAPATRSTRDAFYSTRVRQLLRLELDEAAAESLWMNAGHHRRDLYLRLGRDVGQRVALLDFLLNIRPEMGDPQIVDQVALDRMEQLTITDPLTGLYNRRHFEAALVREVERYRRYGSALSLLIFDLDGFKQINDRFGHRTGDDVLRAVGALVMRHVRGADVPCRYGGDEFAVVLPDTALADAAAMANRIRLDIADALGRRPIAGELVPITVSLGVASMAGDGSSAERLFRDADRAMYEAKNEGGNLSVPDTGPPASRGRLALVVGTGASGGHGAGRARSTLPRGMTAVREDHGSSSALERPAAAPERGRTS